MLTWLPQKENYSKKGTILINAFWILSILLLVVSAFAWRISLELKISKMFTSRAKATPAAKAGLYWAMDVKKKDKNDFDSLNPELDPWVNNEKDFKEKIIDKEDVETMVSIRYIDHYDAEGNPVYYYGLIDEERKINLNLDININITIGNQKIDITASEILKTLLHNLNIPVLNPEIISAIIDWRDGDNKIGLSNEPEPDNYRNGKFRVLEELLILKDMDKEKFAVLQKYLTVYGSGKINVNTAERKVLLAVVNSVLDFLKRYISNISLDSHSLVDQIITQREVSPFKNIEELLPFFGGIPISSQMLNALLEVRSTAFQTNIEVNMGKVKKTVKAIFNTEKKILYWNED
ncbi:MAG: general secretion pathway protein GspK [Candidatus Omnitrophica bacterium]|nr:general secretion pathway protein GspK [Candidatus Omnitrophota bacterium]MCM8793426.1 general secretion pathway protein GspK [Candidatus Omnitrophota bacterium]